MQQPLHLTRRRRFALVLCGLAVGVALPAACVDSSDPALQPATLDAGGVDGGAVDGTSADVTSPPVDAPVGTDATSSDATSSDTSSDAGLDAAADAAGEAAVDAGPPRILYVNGGIWVMDPDGSNKTKLIGAGGVNYGHPAWSPDRTKIAFNSDQDDGSGEIYVMNANGSNVIRVTTNVGESDIEPAWSPDGTKIAFTSRRDHTITSIYVADAVANGNVIRVTNALPGSDQAPSWSVGNKIAFWTNEGSIGLHIAVVDLNLAAPPDGGADGGLPWGTNRTGFPGNVAYGISPAWSPDGLMIAYGSDAPGVRHVAVMNGDGGSRTVLTTGTQPEDRPRWSPDGTKLAFERNVAGRNEIFVMNANGTGAVSLTPADSGVTGVHPAW